MKRSNRAVRFAGARRVLAAAALLAATALAPPARAQAEIKIGAVFPFTGPSSVFGNQNFQGVDIAADLVNSRGGVNGRKVVLVKGDGNSTQAAISETNRLITREGVKILTGSSVSSVAMVASQEAERNNAFYWEGMGVANDITGRGFRHLFRVGMNASGLGLPAPDYTIKVLAPKLGIKLPDLKIAVVAEDSGFGKDISAVVREELTKAGAKVVVNESYSARTTDLAPVVLKMRSANVDVVIVTQFINDAVLLQRQMRELNFVPKAFLGTGAGQATLSFAEALGGDVNGIFSSSFPPDVNPAGLSEKARSDLAEFTSRYKAKYATDPAVQESLGFVVGMSLLEDVIGKAASLEAPALREAASRADVPLGSYINGWGLKFDETGQNTRAFGAVVQWQDKRMHVVYPAPYQVKEPVMVPLPAWSAR